MYFALFVKGGAFGKSYHFRELPLEGTGVRPNRQTLYSEAVFYRGRRPGSARSNRATRHRRNPIRIAARGVPTSIDEVAPRLSRVVPRCEGISRGQE
jgi:hypothetical protein